MTRLKQLREEMHLTQLDVAKNIGVDRTTYNKYETGASEPNNEILLKLARFFDVSTDYIFELSDNKKPPTSEDNGRPALASADEETVVIMELLSRLNQENLDKARDHLDYLLARQEETKDK